MKSRFLIYFLIILTIIWGDVYGQDLPGWEFKKQLTINTVGIEILTTLNNFPLLVRLDAANFNFTEARGNGEDIRFTNEQGDELAYEIERWDAVNDVAEIWVRVNEILGNNSTQYITLFWGNEDAGPVSDGGEVFRFTDGFGGVWHLNESGGSHTDATDNNNTGTTVTNPSSIQGVAGRALSFSAAADDKITVSDDNSLDLGTGEYLVSAWINTTAVGGTQQIWHKNAPLFESQIYDDGRIGFWASANVTTTTTVVPNTWTYICLRRRGTDVYIYINGNREANSIVSGDDVSGTSPLWIGAQNQGERFVGIIDEFRYEASGRSGSWIRFSYASQVPGSSVVEFGEKVLATPPPVLGITEDHVIPLNHVNQLVDGSGEVEIGFRVKDPNETDARFNDIWYNLDDSWVLIDPASAAFEDNWKDVNYSSNTNFTGAIHKITINTSEIPALAGGYFPSIIFSLTVTNGVVSWWAHTDAMPLDNEIPNVSVPSQTTPERSPSISGTSSEPLSQVQVTIENETYTGTPTGGSPGFVIPAGVLSNLENGTYPVSVTATDMFGNTSSQTFLGALTIDIQAPGITVDTLVTVQVSPPLKGTVSENGAVVTVSIESESYQAVVADGEWVIPAGTFKLLSEGTFDVVATAVYNDVEGVDGTTEELVIDMTGPGVNTLSLVTNSNTPTLVGTVTETGTHVTVIVAGQSVAATVTQKSWIVEPAKFTPIALGSYIIYLQSTDLAGNTEIDSSSTLVIDQTAPRALTFSPNNIKTTLAPSLRVQFDEPVLPGAGNLVVKLASDSSIHENIPAVSGTGQATNSLEFSLEDSLHEMSQYFILVDDDAVTDLAGNYFTGITLDTLWTLSTASKDDTFIKLITSNDSSGLYPIDRVLSFTLNFTDTVTLAGGNLNVKIETGNLDADIVIPPFANNISTNFTYTVKFGDFTRALNILSLSLDTAATLTNRHGNDVILDIGQDQNLTITKTIGLDGIPLSLDVVKPREATVEPNSFLSYTVTKDIASGSVHWIQRDPTGFIHVDSLINVTLPFSEDMLSAGFHLNASLNPALKHGELYDVTVSVTDSAGTVRSQTRTSVQIGEKVSSIAISPGKTELMLYEQVMFQVLDLVTSLPVSEGVDWTLNGGGTLDSLGNYQATALGNATIIARIGGTLDTLSIRVNSGTFSIPEGSVDTLTVADNLKLELGTPLTLSTFISFSSIDTGLTGMFNLVGPNIDFQSYPVNFVTIMIKVDSNLLNTSAEPGFGVYQMMDNNGLQWRWIPSKQVGEWVSFEVAGSNMGAYILAQNKTSPGISVVQAQGAREGDTLWVSYTSSSNILNPLINLTYLEGGRADSIRTVAHTGSDTLWSFIPGSSVSTRGLVFNFEISDGTRSVSTAFREINITNLYNIPYPDTLLQDIYQTVSLPMNHFNNEVDAMLMDEWGEEDRTVWRLYRYDSNFVELTKRSPVITGESYWFKMQDQIPTITLEAGGSISVPLITGTSLSLHTGWNTFGNPYVFPVPLSHLVTVNNSSPLIVYYYPRENEFYELTAESSIDPFKGYIVWNGSAGALTLSELNFTGAPAAPVVQRKSTTPDAGRLKLFLKGINSVNGELSIAYNVTGARQGVDKMDLPKPGSPESRVSLDLKVPGTAGSFLTDRRGNLGPGQTWNFTARASHNKEPLTLELRGHEKTSQRHRAVLVHKTKGDVWELAREPLQSYSFTSAATGTDEFALHIGNDEYIAEKAVSPGPGALQLGQNYPNPFRSGTTIHYRVPFSSPGESRPVSLDVYNLKGEKVQNLVNKKQDDGSYQVLWNGSSQDQGHLPAGTYFYRLKVGEASLQKKMVLLR